MTRKEIKWFNLATFGGSNTLWSRLKALVDLPGESFPHQPQCSVLRRLELIYVAVAYLASLFLKMRSQAEVEGVLIWWPCEPTFFGPSAYVDVKPVLRRLFRACRRFILLKDIVRFVSDLLDPWKNFRLQTKAEVSSPRLILRRQESWLRLDDFLLLTLYGVQTSFPNITARSFCLLKTELTVKLLSSENLKIRFPWFAKLFNKRMLLFGCFCIIATLNRCILERVKYLPPISLTNRDTVETGIFYFCASLIISNDFKRCSTWRTINLPTFGCFEPQFFKPRLAFVRQYLTASNFL